MNLLLGYATSVILANDGKFGSMVAGLSGKIEDNEFTVVDTELIKEGFFCWPKLLSQEEIIKTIITLGKEKVIQDSKWYITLSSSTPPVNEGLLKLERFDSTKYTANGKASYIFNMKGVDSYHLIKNEFIVFGDLLGQFLIRGSVTLCELQECWLYFGKNLVAIIWR